MNLFVVLSCEELLVKIFADEEEVEHAERMANGLPLKIESKKMQIKKGSPFTPGICQGPGQ